MGILTGTLKTGIFFFCQKAEIIIWIERQDLPFFIKEVLENIQEIERRRRIRSCGHSEIRIRVQNVGRIFISEGKPSLFRFVAEFFHIFAAEFQNLRAGKTSCHRECLLEDHFPAVFIKELLHAAAAETDLF